MTVEELALKLNELIQDGKGNYKVVVGFDGIYDEYLDVIKFDYVHDKRKEVIFCEDY